MKAIFRQVGPYKSAVILDNPEQEFGTGFMLSCFDPERTVERFNEDLEEYVQQRILKAKVERITKWLTMMAHDKITRSKGKQYAPDVHELQTMIDTLIKQEKEK